MNYEEMTLEELEIVLSEKQAAVETARLEQEAVAAVVKEKRRALELQQQISVLSSEDVEALRNLLNAQSLSAPGIASTAEVGQP